MERLVYQPDCGCQVYRIMHSKPNLYRIQYCPKHEAAPDLYEALKGALKCLEASATMTPQMHFQETRLILPKIRQALADAEGKC